MPYIKLSSLLEANVVIGVSLSEPHTSELNDTIFIYIYIYIIYLLYVFRMSFRLQFNATVRCMWSTSNIFTLQTTFQNEQSVHSIAKTARRDS